MNIVREVVNICIDDKGKTIGADICENGIIHFYSILELRNKFKNDKTFKLKNAILNNRGIIRGKNCHLSKKKILIPKVIERKSINVQKDFIQINKSSFVRLKGITANTSSCTEKICIITEDRGSAIHIILSIIEYFAYKMNITIEWDLITASGYNNIPTLLNYVRDNMYMNILVILDNIEDTFCSTAIKITEYVLQIRARGIKCVLFHPRCIEECSLTYGLLKKELKGLSIEQKELLNMAYNYFKTGDETNFMHYDIIQNEYILNKHIEKLNFKGNYIKKYKDKDINTLERYFAEKLAELTFMKPYMFNKDKGIHPCWFKNCGSSCYLEKQFGTKTPYKVFNYCNKTCLLKDKIDILIQYSMYGCIYELLFYLHFGKYSNLVSPILLNKVVEV